MNNKHEQPFIIDGVKSWIHCIERIGRVREENFVPTYHYHDYIELLYAIDADAYVWINGKKFNFRSGDLIIINSKEPHTDSFLRESFFICIKFSPQILYADENSLFEFKYVQPFLSDNSHHKIFTKEDFPDCDIHKLIIEIMEEWKNKGPAYELIIRSNILKIFAGIFRHFSDNNALMGEAKITPVLKKAIKYIDENFASVSEADVARYCNLSYNHFSFMFKNTMGKSFKDYISFLRLQEAEKLLLSTNKSITEIAAETGFSTSSYFTATFKKHKGVTPKAFRKI